MFSTELLLVTQLCGFDENLPVLLLLLCVCLPHEAEVTHTSPEPLRVLASVRSSACPRKTAKLPAGSGSESRCVDIRCPQDDTTLIFICACRLQIFSYLGACDHLCELGYDEAQVQEALEMFHNSETKVYREPCGSPHIMTS